MKITLRFGFLRTKFLMLFEANLSFAILSTEVTLYKIARYFFNKICFRLNNIILIFCDKIHKFLINTFSLFFTHSFEHKNRKIGL